MCGIYMIRSRASGKFYIGGTTMSFEERFQRHRANLRRGEGPPLLQVVYDELGFDNLEFVPLKQLPADQVSEKEREAIDKLHPGLNIYGARTKDKLSVLRLYTYRGRDYTLRELARETGLGTQTIFARAKRGITGDDLVAPPHKAPRKPYTSRA